LSINTLFLDLLYSQRQWAVSKITSYHRGIGDLIKRECQEFNIFLVDDKI
jgi:hypothetical protein